MQNSVDVMYITLYIKNKQIKWKKFIFIRYHDSCVDNKETALNPGAHFSSLLINENGALLCVLKTCSDTSSSVVFLMVSGNLSATSWSEEGTSSITLTMFFSF